LRRDVKSIRVPSSAQRSRRKDELKIGSTQQDTGGVEKFYRRKLTWTYKVEISSPDKKSTNAFPYSSLNSTYRLRPPEPSPSESIRSTLIFEITSFTNPCLDRVSIILSYVSISDKASFSNIYLAVENTEFSSR